MLYKENPFLIPPVCDRTYDSFFHQLLYHTNNHIYVVMDTQTDATVQSLWSEAPEQIWKWDNIAQNYHNKI